MAHFLPAAHQVVAIAGYHAVELGDFIGRILQVGIHCNDHRGGGCFKAFIQRGALAIVTLEADAFDAGKIFSEPLYNCPAAIRAAVVYHDDLVAVVVLCAHTVYPLGQLREAFFLIEKRNDDG